MRRPLTYAVLAVAATAAGCEHTTSTVERSPAGIHDGPAASDFDTKPTPAVTADTHYAAGQLAESRGDLDRAEQQYRAAVKLKPDDQRSLFRLGMILTAERKPDATDVWKRYVTATGGTATAYSDLGFALDLANRPAEAEAAFKAGIAKDAACEACRVNYARFLARRGHLDAAADQLSAVLSPAEVQFDLGSICEQQGNRPAAIDHYRRAVQLDPNQSDAKARLAAVE